MINTSESQMLTPGSVSSGDNSPFRFYGPKSAFDKFLKEHPNVIISETPETEARNHSHEFKNNKSLGTDKASAFVTQALSGVTSLLTTAGVQASTAQAALGSAIVTASAFTLFGMAIRPATVQQNANEAAKEIERNLNVEAFRI